MNQTSIKRVGHVLLVLSAIIPATYLVLFCFISIKFILTGAKLNLTEVLIALSALLGILGYLGLLAALFRKHEKRPKLVLLFLACGIFAFLLFNSIGGWRAWKWIFTLEEPDEWFILVWPNLIVLLYCIKISRTLLFPNVKTPN